MVEEKQLEPSGHAEVVNSTQEEMTEEAAKTSVLFAAIPTFIFAVVFIIDLYCSIYMHVRILFSALRKVHLLDPFYITHSGNRSMY